MEQPGRWFYLVVRTSEVGESPETLRRFHSTTNRGRCVCQVGGDVEVRFNELVRCNWSMTRLKCTLHCLPGVFMVPHLIP
jgi:hypothetical protein